MVPSPERCEYPLRDGCQLRCSRSLGTSEGPGSSAGCSPASRRHPDLPAPELGAEPALRGSRSDPLSPEEMAFPEREARLQLGVLPEYPPRRIEERQRQLALPQYPGSDWRDRRDTPKNCYRCRGPVVLYRTRTDGC